MGATAVIGSGLLGAASNIFGASSAANAQKKAAQTAANTQLMMFNAMSKDLAPYRAIGGQASDYIGNNLQSLIAPINMDQASLEKTPGYQFTLKQGLKAVQNSAAARGLGVSGAAMKGASDYATGLANKTYLDQFNVANTNATNTWNRLFGTAGLGANAAAMTGQAGLTTGQGIGNNLMSAGNAQAGANMAMGNAGANLFNGLGGYAMYQSLKNPGGGFWGSGGNNSNAWAGYNQTGLPGNAI
jgi:hypothetical protein